MRGTKLALVLITLLVGGCSSKQWYEGSRAGLAEECRRTANEAQYQRCMEDVRLAHEDYQRRRDGIDTPDTMRR